MTIRITAAFCSLALVSTHLLACAGPTDPGEDVATAQQAEETENALSWNGLIMNGLIMNGLIMNGLIMNGLTITGLQQTSSLASTLDSDALARLYFTYVVSCALPAGQDIVFPSLAGQSNYTFYGSLGIAPQWGTNGSTCDSTCQQWVSGCVIARVNALGQHVPLSIRGNNAALTLGPNEATAYPRREATYFGNVLSVPQKRYACRTAGDDQALIGRPCGNGSDASGCVITVLGDCDSVCSSKNADGSYGSCTTPSDGQFVPAVTVYRQ
jgi:hypothetical protein